MAAVRSQRSVRARHNLRITIARIVLFAAVVGLWQLGSNAHLIDPTVVPSPLAIWASLVKITLNGQLAFHAWITIQETIAGFVIGAVGGIAVGLAVGLWSAARSPGMAVVSALFPIPKIALVPLFIIWFGIGEGSKIVTLAFGVFFPTVIATVGGVDNVPRGLIRMAQSFGLSHAAIVRKIVLPGALPALLSGFRVTASIAIILLVAAEMIGADRGIGAFVLAAGNLYDTGNLLAGIVVLSAMGLVVAWLIGRVERWLLVWR